jgi:sec-independent protein translocase protein TatA
MRAESPSRDLLSLANSVSLAIHTREGYSDPMPNIGTGEIILLLLLALLLFGAKRLPEIGRSLGSGMKEFKDSVTGKDRDDRPELPTSTTSETTSETRERETV